MAGEPRNGTGLALTVASDLMKLKSAAACAAIALISATSMSFSTGTAGADDLHNVTYRARIDGIARGALITYKVNDTQVNTSDPTMLPGRIFEANAVLSDPSLAGMRVSIQWPYSANLHCEILVDDNIVAQADDFIGPRLTPANDDPDYGALTCGASLVDPVPNSAELANAGAGVTTPPAPGQDPAPAAPVTSAVPAPAN